MRDPDIVYLIYSSERGGFYTEYSTFAEKDHFGWSGVIHHYNAYESMIAIITTYMYANSEEAIKLAKTLNEPHTYVVRYYPDTQRVDFTFPLWQHDVDQSGDSDGQI